MKEILMDNGLKLQMIEEAILFNYKDIEKLQKQFNSEEVQPILVHRGYACKYLTLYQVKLSFLVIDNSHPGFQEKKQTEEDKLPQLVTKLVSPKSTQICIISEEAYKLNNLSDKFYHKLPEQEEIYISVYENNSENHSESKEGYLRLKNYNKEPILSLATIVVGENCRQQLREWNIHEHELIKPFL